eukprot:Nk52_evm4s545 gene=Nk52_evmTU4s545
MEESASCTAVSEGQVEWEDRWSHIAKTLTRTGPFATAEFDAMEEEVFMMALREQVRILVIGAGGLGCELLKDLTLLGFHNIDVIDMDTIDVSNLNRQFLFRAKDVGKPKAVVAAEFIRRRVAGAKIAAHFCKIQDKDEEFYRGFNMVVCGLDSIAARRWMNALLVSLLKYNADGELDETSVIPMVDGGTEGFRGQSRIILPGKSSCFECSLSTFPPQVTFPLCTIATTPRLPEHCIEYAKIVLWNNLRNGEELDTDDPEHLQWLYEKSLERASEFGIGGVTYRLTQGVVKNIIPAIASTNAIIAASCAQEAFKLCTGCYPALQNYMMYNGQDGLYTYTFEYMKRDDCIVCSKKTHELDVKEALHLQDEKNECIGDPKMCKLKYVLSFLMEDPSYQMKGPGISCNGKTVYMSNPPFLAEKTKPNLEKSLQELGIGEGSVLVVTDPAIPNSVELKIRM